MSDQAVFHMHVAAALLFAVLAVLLVTLQLERFEAYKRRIALSSIAIFFAGATAIWYLEEIRAMLWEDPPLAQLARGSAREASDDALAAARDGKGGGGAIQRNGGRSGAIQPANVNRNRFQECPTCPEMVIIPRSTHAQPIPSFAIGRFELTLQEFHTFVTSSGYAPSRHCEGALPVAKASQIAAYARDGLNNASGRPVACISSTDAQAYLRWLSAKIGRTYRLPTAAEWAHAASTGEAPKQAKLVSAAQASPAAARLEIAGSSANRYGAFDMAGNVAEWVEGHTAMGGSFTGGDSLTRSQALGPDAASASIGLRVARDLPQTD